MIILLGSLLNVDDEVLCGETEDNLKVTIGCSVKVCNKMKCTEDDCREE